MSQKNNNGRDFTIDLSDDDDYLDFGTDDDDFDNMAQVHNLTLTELFDRDELKRHDRERREGEERQARRSQTQENTVSNSGDFPCFMFLCICLCPHYFLSTVVTSPELPSTKCKCITCKTVFDNVIRALYEDFEIVNSQKLCSICWQKQFQIDLRLCMHCSISFSTLNHQWQVPKRLSH